MSQYEKVQWKNQLVNFLGVILGVYIAFYLTNRKTGQDRRGLEKSYLQSMIVDLENDIVQLTVSTDTLKYYRSLLSSLIRKVYAKQTPNNDSLREMINSLYLSVPFIPGNSTYQSLVESGNLDIIENFELRKKITELYHPYYGAIDVIDRLNDEQRINIITPYLINHIAYTNNGLVNASKVWSDPAFVNVVAACYYSLSLKYDYDSAALRHCMDLKLQIQQQ